MNLAALIAICVLFVVVVVRQSERTERLRAQLTDEGAES